MTKSSKLTLLAFSAFAFSMPAYANTLMEVYRLAEDNDPQFRIADSERRATMELYPQARSFLMPSVSARGLYADNQGNGFGVDTKFYSFTLTLTQPLFNGALWSGFRQADARIRQSEINYAVAQQDLMIRVASRYFDVLAAKDSLDFARTTKSAIHRQLDQSKQRFEVGLIAITDVQESQAGYDLAVADEILAQNQLNTAYEALREITGQYSQTLVGLKEEIELVSPEPANIDEWANTALDNNPQLLASRLDVEIAREEVKRQRAGHYPTLDLNGQYEYSHTEQDGGNMFFNRSGYNETYGASVQLNVPIFQGGRVVSQTREAKIRHVQSLDRLEQQHRAIQRQARDTYLNVLAGISRVQALGQAVVSSKTAYEATETGFEVGTRTSVDVLNSQRDLLRAQRDYARSRYDYILNMLRLKQASGQLVVEDLAKLERWFNEPVVQEGPQKTGNPVATPLPVGD
ncbi:MAG: TolC family outer membrane protein [Pseudomonadota bacterium]